MESLTPALPIRVVCGIIVHEGKVLAAQRSSIQTNALLWEFPGGKINENENESDALTREMHEELGIIVMPGLRLTPVVHRYPSFTIQLIPFVCALLSGTPQPHEHAQIRWVVPEEAIRLLWAPADIPVVEEYLQMQ